MTEKELLRIRRRVMHLVTRRMHAAYPDTGLYVTDAEAWEGRIKEVTFKAFETVIKDELKRVARRPARTRPWDGS